MSNTLHQPLAGERLRALRELARLTRPQLSAQTGVPISAIARLETGKDVRLSTYLPILDHFAKRSPEAWLLAQRFVLLTAPEQAELLAALEAAEVSHE